MQPQIAATSAAQWQWFFSMCIFLEEYQSLSNRKIPLNNQMRIRSSWEATTRTKAALDCAEVSLLDRITFGSQESPSDPPA